MKKTLQILMVAASALLGAVSCGGGGGNGGASANAAALVISPGDFARGKQGYELTIKGVRCLLRGQYGSYSDTEATVPNGIFYLDDEGYTYTCKLTYQLNASEGEAPTQSTMVVEFDAGQAEKMKRDVFFKKFWGITDESVIEDGDAYGITLSFPDSLVLAKCETAETTGRFTVVRFEDAGDAAAPASGR